MSEMQARHLLGLLRDASQRRGAIRLGKHSLAEHRCIAPDDPERAAQLVRGDIQKLALEAFEATTAFGLLLELVDRRGLADPKPHEAGEPDPDVPIVVVEIVAPPSSISSPTTAPSPRTGTSTSAGPAVISPDVIASSKLGRSVTR